MKIKEIVIFGYATKGEALEVANATEEDTCVGIVTLMNGLKPAEKPVCFLVLPSDRFPDE